MAQISISQKYFEDAIPLLEKALQIAPERSDIRAALGESYFKSGKIDKAIEEFKRLIEVEPSVRAYARSRVFRTRILEGSMKRSRTFRTDSNWSPTIVSACSTWAISQSCREIQRVRKPYS